MLNILKILHVYPHYSGWEVNFLVETFPLHLIYLYTDIYQGLKIFANTCIYIGGVYNVPFWEMTDGISKLVGVILVAIHK